MSDVERLERRVERERRARKEAERLLEEKSRELFDTNNSLKSSAETLTAVIDAVPAKINARGPDGRYVFMNAYQKKILGLVGRDVTGLLPREIVDETYETTVANTDEEVLRTKLPILGYDETIADADGNELVWLSNKVPIYDESDDLRLIVNVSVNITRRKVQEQERKALESQLRQSQKMESLGTLAGGTAHEFNNMLVPIIGLTELVMEDLPEDSLERGNLERVLEAADRARSLVKQILTFSREQPREIDRTDLVSVVRDALTLIKTTTPSTVQITDKLQDEPLTILADPTELHQILMNLTGNAAHAMDGRNGSIEIHLDTVDVDATNVPADLALTPGHYAHLSIADTGCGMDRATVERIFEPFFTTKEVGKGTGLGLAMVHAIITRAEGDICVTSEPGAGTTFEIFWPLCGRESKQAEEGRDGQPDQIEKVA